MTNLINDCLYYHLKTCFIRIFVGLRPVFDDVRVDTNGKQGKLLTENRF